VLDTIHAIHYWLTTCGVYHRGYQKYYGDRSQQETTCCESSESVTANKTSTQPVFHTTCNVQFSSAINLKVGTLER